MARYRGPVCRHCRREGIKLFLKGERCYTDKCAVERRNYAPGQHGRTRSKFSDYGNQLREKQKVKRIYGILEKQCRKSFRKASRQRGITGENFLVLLERRLDNVVFRLGFASTRNEARQLVGHRHFLVNGKPTNIPSCVLKPGDTVELREKSRKVARITEAIESVERRGTPRW
ncbi:MAG: 30S ribosomal protein S4, partial [Deltaproteobacteria bacterium]|nr:30S ribosomal protein S4 [Deltaproteobacteria bacterium]